MVSVPEHLDSTYVMLKQAFNQGFTEEEYEAAIKLLYAEMSDRNIATVLSLLTNRDEAHVINDVYRVSQSDLDNKVIERVESVLKKFGYDEWLNE